MVPIERGKFPNPDPKEIEKNWRERGYSFGIMTDPPGQRWENFTHSVDEVVTPLNASVEVEVEGEKAVLLPGDEWFIPKGAVHSVRNKSKTTARWCYGYKQE